MTTSPPPTALGDQVIAREARTRLDSLAKPAGALGALEDLAIRLCTASGHLSPQTRPRTLVIFAGDHGAVSSGVSIWPSTATGAIAQAILSGQAASNVIAAEAGLRRRASSDAYAWTAGYPDVATAPAPAEDDEDDVERDAERSGLFFTLRDEPRQQSQPAIEPPARGPQTFRAAQSPEPAPPARSSDRALFPGAIIPASLVTELNSEAPGPVIAQVTQSIYDSATGRNLLIPQGARLIGDYRSSTRYGQSRVAIVWQRLIMPDGEERVLDEAAVSPSGAAGVAGEVENHWTEMFGAAMLGTLINVGVATTEDPQITFSGIGAVSRDPVDQAIQDGIQHSANTVTNRVVDRGLAIPPTIRVQAGARISVIVTRRTYF